MSCKKHFNWTTDTPCPYCRIEELERENERDRCHGRDFIRLWKEGKERISELEQQLAHKQEQCDQLAHQVLELEQKIEYEQQRNINNVAMFELQLADERHDCADLALQVAKLEQQLAALKQVSAELCDTCGWRMQFPGEECCKCKSERLEQQLADEKKAAGYWMEQSCKDHNRAEKVEQQLSCYHNLLAVAHRDGGQYLAQHGEEKAGEDAITAILTAYHNNDRYQGGIEVEGVISEFGDILLLEPTPIDIGKRVRVHVKEVE